MFPISQIISTDKRRKGAKRLLRILDLRDIPKSCASKKLAQPVKLRKSTGEIVEKERIYQHSKDAKELVRMLEKSDKFPIESKGSRLTRTDRSDSGGDLT